MGATLLDGVVMEPGSIVGAGAVVPPGAPQDQYHRVWPAAGQRRSQQPPHLYCKEGHVLKLAPSQRVALYGGVKHWSVPQQRRAPPCLFDRVSGSFLMLCCAMLCRAVLQALL
jgi:hypothetical protein